MTTVTTTPPTTEAELIGQPVILWGWEGVFVYKGDNGSLGMERVGFGAVPSVETSFERVAPADVVIPQRDIRVNVTKGDRGVARRHGHYGNAWMLNLPGRPTTWFNTKREAVAAGLRRCAILDWHASLK